MRTTTSIPTSWKTLATNASYIRSRSLDGQDRFFFEMAPNNQADLGTTCVFVFFVSILNINDLADDV